MDNTCDYCSSRLVDADLAAFGHVKYRMTLCHDCFNRQGRRVPVNQGSMQDGGWPIYDELTLERCVKDFERLVRHGDVFPEDVILERIPDIANHIVGRAFELNLQKTLPIALTDRAFGDWANRKLYSHWDEIERIAAQAHQLARETRASRDAGAG